MTDRPELRAKIKAVRAPSQITTPQQALEAFARLEQYREMSEYAKAQYHRYTGGTHTSQRHYARYEAYAEVADEWSDVLRAYLRTQAETPRVEIATP